MLMLNYPFCLKLLNMQGFSLGKKKEKADSSVYIYFLPKFLKVQFLCSFNVVAFLVNIIWIILNDDIYKSYIYKKKKKHLADTNIDTIIIVDFIIHVK
jgi:hypothetical protein